ncbi:MAG TPA: NAD(P)/FAD-dependent oxidoreductase [Candidatus Nitrosocosmicus sp.]|nr:NAD(P)/FAD-dependent oxidoreductase [Candidatus Nitrosocosmicus sp.]
MKVAIIGAGLAGLSCAIELERHGISPAIFEKRAHVGEALDYSVIWPRVINRPLKDPLKYIKKEYNLDLYPINHIKKIVMLSPGHRSVERGSLGYIFKRGHEKYSVENQLLNYVKSPVIFNKYVEPEYIDGDFDYVIVANATSITAKKLGLWTDTFNAQTRIATVVGRFIPTEIIMWMNTAYAKNGFCYLIPTSEKQAYMVQIVNGITSYELDYYWKEFLFSENIDYYISSTSDAEHDCGFVQPLQAGKVLFTGNAAGFTDDLIGCGGFNAVESGMLAARAIVSGKDYNTLAQPIYTDIVKLHEFRKAMNTLDNHRMDILVKLLGLPLLKNTMYNNPFFRVSDTWGYVRLYNRLVKKRKSVE